MRLPRVLITALFLITAPAFAQEPGNLWDLTTSMEMAGMKMPGQKQQVCIPVDAEGPDAMASEKDTCKVTDVQASPGRYSYKMQCPDGSGTGLMTYQGNDSFTSDVTMITDGETMKMLTTGKRVGSCDAGALKKKIAGMEARMAATKEETCASVPQQMLPALLDNAQCDARYKKQLCDRFGTREGFQVVAARQPVGEASIDSGTLSGVSKYCGVQPDPIRKRLCTEADQAHTEEDLKFIGDACAAESQVIAQRECAGRGYTTPPAAKYREFCNAYARGMMDGSLDAAQAEGAEGVPAAPTATDALKEGAKRLKGLFGR
ncbi:MAG: DUF3617 family protein [Gammaproteobacteria bacterium]|nr:DUF3617 family protein [Gammaproteobacteria bacterium]